MGIAAKAGNVAGGERVARRLASSNRHPSPLPGSEAPTPRTLSVKR